MSLNIITITESQTTYPNSITIPNTLNLLYEPFILSTEIRTDGNIMIHNNATKIKILLYTTSLRRLSQHTKI